jgi:mannosyltransferase
LLEAMTCGCPVVALRTSSIPEVAGDGALLLDAATPESITGSFEAIRNPRLRSALIKRGLAQAERFSWQLAAKRYSAVYDSVSNWAGNRL